MNCSATVSVGGFAPGRKRIGRAILCCVSALLMGSPCAAQGIAELDDAAARAQYAYLTSDARALEQVLAEVAEADYGIGLAALRSYQLAYGHWKLAQVNVLRGEAARSGAAKAARACVELAKAAVRQDAQLAEAYAVQAICEEKPQAALRIRDLQAGSCDRNRALRTAQTIAPKNPRVMLISALCTRPGESEREISRWREVVAAFDGAPRPRSAAADWGHAEALTLAAELLFTNGQLTAARDAIERALVIAPDYDAAQALLQSITRSR